MHSCGRSGSSPRVADPLRQIAETAKAAALRPQVFLERNRVIVFLVMRAVDERHQAASGRGQDGRQDSGCESSSRKYRVRNWDHLSGS